MKINILCIGFFLGVFMLSCSSNSQDKSKDLKQEVTVVDTTKVTWIEDITEALAKAKATGKLLFVECYSPTCPICQSIEPYFSTSEVAKRYNTDFVNYKLDVGVAEQVKFLNDRNIYLPSFPQFLFFDGDGKLVHQGEVHASSESIVGVAADALDPNKRSGNYKARFDGGEISTDFLVKYAVYTRLIKDTLENHKVADVIFDNFPKGQLNTELSWGITKKAVTTVDNGFFQHWIANTAKAAEYEKKAGHAGQEMNSLSGIVQASIFKDGRTYNTSKIQKVKGYMSKVGAAEYADSFLWEFEVLALYRENKPAEALKVASAMAQKFINNGPSLVYIVKVLNDNATDNAYLGSAAQWLKTAQPLIKENNQLAEFYYESAKVSNKAGDRAGAKLTADKALQIAKTAGLDQTKYNTLISNLK